MNRHTGKPCEVWPEGYFARVRKVAAALEEQYAGKVVLCFSHAAALALAAALLGSSIAEVGRFAPCGMLVLRRRAAGAGGSGVAGAGATAHVGEPEHEPWVLELKADSNAHVARNNPTTYPWTYADEHQAIWEGRI